MAKRHHAKRGKLVITKNSVSGEKTYAINFNGILFPVEDHTTGGLTDCFKEIAALPTVEVDDVVAKHIKQENTFVNKQGEVIVKEPRTHRKWFYSRTADDTGTHYYQHDGFSEEEYDNLPAQKATSTSRRPESVPEDDL